MANLYLLRIRWVTVWCHHPGGREEEKEGREIRKKGDDTGNPVLEQLFPLGAIIGVIPGAERKKKNQKERKKRREEKEKKRRKEGSSRVLS